MGEAHFCFSNLELIFTDNQIGFVTRRYSTVDCHVRQVDVRNVESQKPEDVADEDQQKKRILQQLEVLKSDAKNVSQKFTET